MFGMGGVRKDLSNLVSTSRIAALINLISRSTQLRFQFRIWIAKGISFRVMGWLAVSLYWFSRFLHLRGVEVFFAG